MDIPYLTPILNIIGSVIFFALLKPRIEKWQDGKLRMEKSRQQFLAEMKDLVSSANTAAKRQQLGQLIALTAGVEREMVKRFYRIALAFAFVAVISIWADFNAFIFVQAEKYQWVFHVNAAINSVLALFLTYRAHVLDEELSAFELEVILGYCSKTHEELAKS